MKKYEIKINEIKEMVFEVKAKNKTEAIEMIRDIINASSIFQKKQIKKTKKFIYDIKRVRL